MHDSKRSRPHLAPPSVAKSVLKQLTSSVLTNILSSYSLWSKATNHHSGTSKCLIGEQRSTPSQSVQCNTRRDQSDPNTSTKQVKFKNQIQRHSSSPPDYEPDSLTDSRGHHMAGGPHGPSSPSPINLLASDTACLDGAVDPSIMIKSSANSSTDDAMAVINPSTAATPGTLDIAQHIDLAQNDGTTSTNSSPARATDDAMVTDDPMAIITPSGHADRLASTENGTEQQGDNVTNRPLTDMTDRSEGAVVVHQLQRPSTVTSAPLAFISNPSVPAPSGNARRVVEDFTSADCTRSTPETATLDQSRTSAGMQTHTPRIGTRKGRVSMPLKRIRKAIRSREECVMFYKSSGAQSLDSPPAMPQAYDHPLRIADLYVHHGWTEDTFQTWMWSGRQWTEVGVDTLHPLLSGYHLKLLDNGEPSWVTRKTMVTDQGRMKRKQCV